MKRHVRGRLAAHHLGARAALAVGVLALAGCQAGASTPIPATPTPAASTASTAPGPTDAVLPPQDPIEGVVVHVDSTGLNSVKGFTLRAIDGQTYDFVIGRLQNGSQFPPGHLVEHAANSEPILVTFEGLGPTIIAVRLDDANPPASSAPPTVTGTPSPS